MNKLIAALLLVTPLMTNAAQADFYGPCGDGNKAQVEIGVCLMNKVKAEQKALAALYQAQVKEAYSPEVRAKLIQSQKAWEQYKDAEIALSYEENKGGQAAGNFATELESRLINYRIAELKDALSINQ